MAAFSSGAGRYIVKMLGFQFGLSASNVEEFLSDDRTVASIGEFLKGDERVTKLIFFYQTRDTFTEDGEFIEAAGNKLRISSAAAAGG